VANVKITELTALTDPASSDVLPIVDVGADETKKVTIADLLENAGDGSAANPAFSFDNDKNTGIYRPGVDQLAISTGGTGRLFIDSSGNAGIGTSGPVGPLHVAGDTSAAGEYSILNVSDTSDTTKGLRLAYDDVNDCGVIAASDRGSGWKNVVIAPALGNVGIGTASPAVACDVDGQVRAANGILFGSDTAAANALDDYEEGTWTPVHSDGTNTATLSGLYRKVGNIVYFRVRTSVDSGTATLKVGSVSGLPFTNISTIVGVGGKVIKTTGVTSDTSFVGYDPNHAAINLNLAGNVTITTSNRWVCSFTAVVF